MNILILYILFYNVLKFIFLIFNFNMIRNLIKNLLNIQNLHTI